MTRRDSLRSLLLCLGVVPCTSRANSRQVATPSHGSQQVRIDDEFSPLKSVIVHDASNARDIEPEELFEYLLIAEERGQKHPEAGPVSGVAVQQEIARFRELLMSRGVELLMPDPVANAMSQVFTRDPAFVIGQTMFIGSMFDDYRSVELDGLDRIRTRLPRAIDLRDEGVAVEGGDIMVLDRGRTVLIGTNTNTNDAGFNVLSAHLKKSGAKVVRVPHRSLHLDCCLAPLPDGSALIHGRGLSKQAFPVLKTVFKNLIPLDRTESERYLAANLLWLDPENVVSSNQAKKTNDRLRSLGYKVQSLNFSNVKRMWGSFRCVTCPIRRG